MKERIIGYAIGAVLCLLLGVLHGWLSSGAPSLSELLAMDKKIQTDAAVLKERILEMTPLERADLFLVDGGVVDFGKAPAEVW